MLDGCLCGSEKPTMADAATDENDWRFKGFGVSQLGNVSSSSPASVSSGGHVGDSYADPSSPERDAFAAKVWSQQHGVTGASRVIPSPSNTSWNGDNNNDWRFRGFGPSQLSGTQPSSDPDWRFRGFGESNLNKFSSDNASKATSPDFYKSRTANMDITSSDHQLYGAGPDVGFNN